MKFIVMELNLENFISKKIGRQIYKSISLFFIYYFVNKYDILDELEFILDDYEVDSYGPIESIDWEEIK